MGETVVFGLKLISLCGRRLVRLVGDKGFLGGSEYIKEIIDPGQETSKKNIDTPEPTKTFRDALISECWHCSFLPHEKSKAPAEIFHASLTGRQ